MAVFVTLTDLPALFLLSPTTQPPLISYCSLLQPLLPQPKWERLPGLHSLLYSEDSTPAASPASTYRGQVNGSSFNSRDAINSGGRDSPLSRLEQLSGRFIATADNLHAVAQRIQQSTAMFGGAFSPTAAATNACNDEAAPHLQLSVDSLAAWQAEQNEEQAGSNAAAYACSISSSCFSSPPSPPHEPIRRGRLIRVTQLQACNTNEVRLFYEYDTRSFASSRRSSLSSLGDDLQVYTHPLPSPQPAADSAERATADKADSAALRAAVRATSKDLAAKFVDCIDLAAVKRVDRRIGLGDCLPPPGRVVPVEFNIFDDETKSIQELEAIQYENVHKPLRQQLVAQVRVCVWKCLH